MRILRNLFVMIFLVFPVLAHAQQDLSTVLKGTSRYLKQGSGGIAASIGEDKFNFDAKKGDFVEGTFTVYNANSFSVIIDLTPTAMVAGPGGNTNVVPLASAGPNNLARHLKFRPKRFAMPPRSQKNVQFSINIPKGLSDGTHYTAFGVSSSATTKKAARLKESELVRVSEMGFSPALRVNVSVNVGGAGAGGGGRGDYDITGAQVKVGGSGSLVGTVTLKSKGGAEVPLTVAAVVLDSSGKVVARLRPQGKTVLKPNEQKTVELESSARRLDSGKYRVKVTVLGENAKTKTKETSFTIR